MDLIRKEMTTVLTEKGKTMTNGDYIRSVCKDFVIAWLKKEKDEYEPEENPFIPW